MDLPKCIHIMKLRCHIRIHTRLVFCFQIYWQWIWIWVIENFISTTPLKTLRDDMASIKEPSKILVLYWIDFCPLIIDPWWSIWCRILVYPCPNHEWIIHWRHCGMIWRPSRIHLKFWFCIGDNSCLIMIDAWRRFWCKILIEPWPNHGCSIQSNSHD